MPTNHRGGFPAPTTAQAGRHMDKKYPSFAQATCAVAFWLFLFPALGVAQDKPDIFVQLGHSSGVLATAFSPDGKFLISGGYDRFIKLWEVASGKEIKTMKGHDGSVRALAFLNDGKGIVSASDDGTIRIWEITTGKEISRQPVKIEGGFSYKPRFNFSHDANYVVVSDSREKKNFIKVVQVTTGREIKDFSGIRGAGRYTDQELRTAIFSPDGRRILAVFATSMKLLDIERGNEVKASSFESLTFISDDGPVVFSPNGKFVLAGFYGAREPAGSKHQHSLHVFDLATGRLVARFENAHPTYITQVAFSPDSKHAVSADRDGAIKLWDIPGKREVKAFASHRSEIHSLRFAPSGPYFVSGESGPIVRLWSIHVAAEVRNFSGAASAISSIDVSPDGRHALSTSEREIYLWDATTGRREKILNGHMDRINAAIFSPDRKYILSMSGSRKGISDNTLRLWEIATGKEIRKFTGHTDGVVTAAFSPDGRFILSGGFESTARLWETATGTEIKRFDNSIIVVERDGLFSVSGPTKEVNAGAGFPDVGFSKDGKIAFLGRLDYSTGDPLMPRSFFPKIFYDIYDTSTWRKKRTIPGRSSSLSYFSRSASLSPDGNYLLAGGQLIEIATGNERRDYGKDYDSQGATVSFSPDANFFAYTRDKQAEIVKTSSGEVVKKLDGHSGSIFSVKFTGDGRNVLTGSEDGTVRVWNAGEGKEIVKLINFANGEWIAITPDGYYTGSEKADQHLNVRIGNKVYGVDQYREKFYRPDLVKLALAGQSLTGLASLTAVKPAPAVAIVDTPLSVGTDEATVKVKVADAGGGVGDVRVYLNGSAVSLERRNLAVAAVAGKAQVFSYKVKLVSGKNAIRAIAFNAENSMQSTDALHEIEARIAAKKPSLYAVVVGIQEYVNPKLTLKYSVADANLFADTVKGKAGGLFEKVEVVRLVTAKDTTNTSITNALKAVRTKVRPDDLFVFYVASHGTVDEGEYYLVTSNVGSTSTEKLKRDALSQNSIKELIANIPATKKLIVLDTCNAGKLGDTLQVALLTRGMNEDTAFKILSRAVGSTILSAATSQQEALEGYQNHGLFTWVLAEGLNGAADLDKDGFIKTIELASYVDEKVPELAEKVFRHKQFPVVAPSGQAFPIVRVK